MFEWRRYSCEQPGHGWTILARESHDEPTQDLLCRHGHAAVMARRSRPADVISVRIICAAQVDAVNGREYLGNKFYVAIECLSDGMVLISSRFDSKETVLKLAGQFTGMRRDSAMRLWERKFPLSKPGYRIDHD